MVKDLINLTQYADALRSTGYKNIESAISEIIDNSIEAGAKEILIILKEKLDGETGTKKINEIAFLDNGNGMSTEELQSSLRIGCGTRTQRKGMGRFGVGLPQASMHACPRVEVYSWQNYEEPYKVYLDINQIKSGEQVGIDNPVEENLPISYKKFLKYMPISDNNQISFAKNGTFVLWKECDNVKPTKASTLINKLQLTLGQKFRYFINSNQCRIILVNIDNTANPIIIKPNDPLMLMEDNIVLGDRLNPYRQPEEGSHLEPAFEPFNDKNGFLNNGEGLIFVKYKNVGGNEIKESLVKIKCSIVKNEFYGLDYISASKNPGLSYIGKHLKKVEGISIIRAKREVDFGRFDFYSAVNEPVHRWWGMEIEFGTELDEAFGVSNNKQHVELIELSSEEFSEEDIKPVWIELSSIIKPLISEMKSRNKELRANKTRKRGGEDTKVTRKDLLSENIININSINEIDCVSKIVQKENIDLAKSVAEKLTTDNSTSEIENILENKVNIQYKQLDDDGQAFDFDVEKGIPICLINTSHEFYKSFIRDYSDDVKLKTCLELLLGGFLRVIDTTRDKSDRMHIYSLVKEWNKRLTKYMNTFNAE